MKKLLFILMLVPSLVFAHYNKGDKVVLLGIPGCPACATSKQDLTSHNIPFTYKLSTSFGAYPQLYVNGKYVGTGTDAIHTWITE